MTGVQTCALPISLSASVNGTIADGSVIPAAIVPLTDADKELARDGNELEFSVDPDAYRYVTIVCIKNYNVGTSRINVAELTFFGTPEDKIIQ